MASFDQAAPGNAKSGEKILKTQCVQCHTGDKGTGHKQETDFLQYPDKILASGADDTHQTWKVLKMLSTAETKCIAEAKGSYKIIPVTEQFPCLLKSTF